MNCLNLGCGTRFREDWINIDIAPIHPKIQYWNILNGIPFSNNSFDFVYHSHLLEHIPKYKVSGVLAECYRVLKPGGVIRVVVPDLEAIIRLYLENLEAALLGSVQGRQRYHWMLLELYDQAVRNNSGGEMSEYLRQNPIPEGSFVIQRLGGEASKILEVYKHVPNASHQRQYTHPKDVIKRARDIARSVRESLYSRLLGQGDYQALLLGRFRLSGEIHQWMYDRYSLSMVLQIAGFVNPVQQTAMTSIFPEWEKSNLDIEPDGTVYKPDSLFMEAVKPT
jgi:hypothetical protein